MVCLKNKLILIQLIFVFSTLAQDDFFYFNRTIADSTFHNIINRSDRNKIDNEINKSSSVYINNQIRSMYLPKVYGNIVLPDYLNSIDKITLPDGTDDFIHRRQIYSNLGLTINQPIPLLGGDVFVSTSLSQLRLLNNNVLSYRMIPFSVGYTNSSFFYNELKWEKERLELKRNETYIKSIKERNKFYYDNHTILLEYYGLKTKIDIIESIITELKLVKQTQETQLSMNNLDNYSFNQISYELSMAEIDLLQYELLKRQKINELALNLNVNTTELYFLNNLSICVPVGIDTSFFLKSVEDYTASDLLNQHTKISEIEKYKSEFNPKISLRANLGYSNSENDFLELNSNFSDQQTFSVVASIPIINYGNRKNGIKQKENELNKMKIDADLFRIKILSKIREIIIEIELNTKRLKQVNNILFDSKNQLDINRNLYLSGNANINDYFFELKKLKEFEILRSELKSTIIFNVINLCLIADVEINKVYYLILSNVKH